MELLEYNKKRNFTKTPEPKGTFQKNSAERVFVIQKHLASHLHYDFRIEVDGVLKSWAVPKGPSLYPKDKRLAMQTEDHPMDYRFFEGTIPAGNYGAGEVIVWDNGTYDVVGEDSVEQQLKKGHVSLILHGKKVKGEFALVRQKGKEENAWLLIKKQDEYATDEDITKLQNSVLSSKELGDTKKDIITINLSKVSGAKKAEMPHNIKPMLATAIDAPFDKNDFLFEIKWDGYRGIAEVENGKVKLYSRNGNDFTKKYEVIVSELSKLKHNIVLDGEIVVMDESGKPSFQKLQAYEETKKGALGYIVFDLLYLDGYDLQDAPLIVRKEILQSILPKNTIIQFSDHIEENGIEFYNLVKKQGLEGVVAKEKYSRYIPDHRSSMWLKIKAKHMQEALICGYTEPRGSRKEFGALILGQYDNGKLKYIGHTGTGFNYSSLTKTKKLLDTLKIEKSPFKDPPKTNAPVTWVKPELVAQVSYTEWTKDGVMRHPVFLGLREDKEPQEVQKEEVIHKTPEQKVKVTNLSKVYFPKDNITKGDIIRYYEDVSNIILPYLKDRPENLHRFPNGIEQSGFYQKDNHDVPEWIHTQKIYSESEDKYINYIVCQDKDALIYLANLGCIEINPWNSRIQSIENPDYLVIDLDPEDLPFSKVVETAIKVREVLEVAEILSFPKTSGATGMHIYIPLNAKYNYTVVKQFAELLATIVHSRLPKWTSIIRSPEKRQGKVYVDFLQNRFGQTLAAPYSVRPKPHATVSTPLEWKEVNQKLSPDQFTIENILQRLDQKGDLWKGVLGQGINIENTIVTLQNKLQSFA